MDQFTTPDFDRIRRGNDRATEDAVRLLWLMLNDIYGKLGRLGSSDSAEVGLHNLLSATHGDTEAATPSLGDIIVAQFGDIGDLSQFWHDGLLLAETAAGKETGGAKYWFDGEAFAAVDSAGTGAWRRQVRGVEGSVLTIVGGKPVWTPLETVGEEAPPAAVTPAHARAIGQNDRIVYSGSTAVKFPLVSIDTAGMRSWSGTPPSGVTSGAFKIPADGFYSVAVNVVLTAPTSSKPPTDPSNTFFATLRQTTGAGAATDLGTTNTIDCADAESSGEAATVTVSQFFEEGVYLEAHRGGSLSGNLSRVNPSSYFDVKEV